MVDDPKMMMMIIPRITSSVIIIIIVVVVTSNHNHQNCPTFSSTISAIKDTYSKDDDQHDIEV